ncbi:MAG TPA: hypothetical protein VK027_09770 [Chitinophagaceae bacterium]|nr:hypothetical protein [Chitinophagaceae bacterium]
MYWENSYTAIMIPMHFGKDYYINNQQRGDWYFGLSLGLLMHSYAKSGILKLIPISFCPWQSWALVLFLLKILIN